MDIDPQEKLTTTNKVQNLAQNIIKDQMQKVNNINNIPKKQFYKFSFEATGLVTKVYLKKYTQNAAFFLNLVGWVCKSKRETVIGSVEGPYDDCQEMKHWIENIGSPSSCVESVTFGKEKYLDHLNYKDFYIRQPSTGKRFGTQTDNDNEDDDD